MQTYQAFLNYANILQSFLYVAQNNKVTFFTIFVQNNFKMAVTTVNVKTTFDYTSSPKKFIFQDLTDYPGQGVNPAIAAGIFTITAPDGTVIYNNTDFDDPDISPATSVLNIYTIQLPLLQDGSVMQGGYTVVYTVRIAATIEYEVDVTKTYTLSYTRPTVDLSITINQSTPLYKSTDNTAYNISTSLGTIVPTVTRVHTLYYPASTLEAPVVGSGATVTSSTVYASPSGLQYHSDLVADSSYTLGNDFYLIDELTGTAYYDLISDPNLCDVYCGVKNLEAQWLQYKGTPKGDVIQSQLSIIGFLLQLMRMSIECGEDGDTASIAAEIRKIGQFTSSCDCTDTTPQLVVGSGGGGITIVQAGSGMSVSTNVSGTTTTYTVALSSSLLTKLNALRNVTLVAGSNITITTETASDGSLTYTVNSTAPNLVMTQYTVTFTAGAEPTITNNGYKVYGSLFNNPAVAADFPLAIDWPNNNNAFTASGIFFGTPIIYFPTIELVETTQYGSSASLSDQNKPLSIRIIDKNTNDFKFQLLDSTGAPVSGQQVDATYSSITFNIIISA